MKTLFWAFGLRIRQLAVPVSHFLSTMSPIILVHLEELLNKLLCCYIPQDNSHQHPGSTKENLSYTQLLFLDILSANGQDLILYELKRSSSTTYHSLLRHTNTCNRFPATVSTVTVTTLLGDVPSGSTSVKITKLYPVSEASPHVLAVGSVVLYSPCLGCVWYLLPVSHSPTQDYVVATDMSGSSFVKF